MRNTEQHSTSETSSEVQQTTNTGIKALLSELLTESANLQSQYKTWHANVKKLAKEMEKEQKKLPKAKPRRVVRQKPQEVNKSMQKFMHTTGAEKGTSYTRQVMMKQVSAYIKEHTLQNEANKKQWKADKTLKKLFDLNDEWYTFMQINGLLSRVVVKA